MLGDDEQTSTTATPINGGAASALAAGNATDPAVEVEARELRHRTRVWHDGDPRPEWLPAEWMQLSEYAAVYGQELNEILKGCGPYSLHVLLVDAVVTLCATDYLEFSESTGAASAPPEKIVHSPRLRAQGPRSLWFFQARRLGLLPAERAQVSVFLGDAYQEGREAIGRLAAVLLDPPLTEISSNDVWIGPQARAFFQGVHGLQPPSASERPGYSVNLHGSTGTPQDETDGGPVMARTEPISQPVVAHHAISDHDLLIVEALLRIAYGPPAKTRLTWKRDGKVVPSSKAIGRDVAKKIDELKPRSTANGGPTDADGYSSERVRRRFPRAEGAAAAISADVTGRLLGALLALVLDLGAKDASKPELSTMDKAQDVHARLRILKHDEAITLDTLSAIISAAGAVWRLAESGTFPTER